MRTILAALAVGVLAAPARGAEPAWYTSAVAGWSQNMRAVTDFERVLFHDEENVRRVAYYPSTGGGERPIFALDASPVKTRTELDGKPIALTTFRDNAVSEYYVKGFEGSREVLIGRRDRPETVLRGSKLGYWWEEAFIRPGEDPKPFADKQRMIALKPKTWSEAPDSVMTGAAPDKLYCRMIGYLGGLHREVGYRPGTVDILESLLPVEQELALAGIHTASISQASVDAVNTSGSYDLVNADFAAYRKQSVAAVAALAAAGGPDDAFSPAESRFLSCRVAHVAGPDDRQGREARFYEQATRAAQDAAARRLFVAGWRRWLSAELALYPAEAAAAPALPEKPDHRGSYAALEKRTLEALSGAFPADARAAKVQALRPRVDADRTRRRIDDAAKSALEALE